MWIYCSIAGLQKTPPTVERIEVKKKSGNGLWDYHVAPNEALNGHAKEDNYQQYFYDQMKTFSKRVFCLGGWKEIPLTWCKPSLERMLHKRTGYFQYLKQKETTFH